MARSDMFFEAKGQRTGDIAGESADKAFPNQIEIVDWSWGMTAPSAIGGARTGRTLLGELKLVKRADKSTTSLMQVMRNNEILSKAVLSVRKAGGVPLPYFVVELTGARITGFSIESTPSGEGAPILIEHLSLAFKEISVDYTVQDERGGGRSSSNFSAEAAPDA